MASASEVLLKVRSSHVSGGPVLPGPQLQYGGVSRGWISWLWLPPVLLQQIYELQSVGSKLSTEEQEAAGQLIKPQLSTHDAEAPGKLLAAMVAAQEVINAAAYRALGLDTVMLGDLYRPALVKGRLVQLADRRLAHDAHQMIHPLDTPPPYCSWGPGRTVPPETCELRTFSNPSEALANSPLLDPAVVVLTDTGSRREYRDAAGYD
ncbi:hypothetical protein COCSUDRAFT_62663 [Coccomyxa subellipsoidea C-169]|uniref:Uncharacterized protein n=1 Tax=Coccomyxa subellipsoidea (strain C-169) TaxID=574566 RepID=I0Z0H8_COCSC|nr:hypothetical protein COCSUDRAFT_62663 [Coccomyxa subellipsoidea C-169]EIE24147.1 hypothetical protein COCSUDRAFT_62663 [Coccomyxa subellipsoidea C-169]|eukprot:XP_005648691.1 hypothetical protein COCSUDRAFT_62663 [Coccomyxa subellipsoidea C-169]